MSIDIRLKESNSKNKINSENNSSSNFISNSFHSKEEILLNSQSQSINHIKQLSKSLDPFRNTDRLKKNINRLNETLFGYTPFNKIIKIKPMNILDQNENISKQQENKKIIAKVMNSKSKLKLEHMSKEVKLHNKLHEFKNMDTFIDIKKFLKDINILEDPDFKEFLSNLKANLKETRLNKPIAIEKNEFYEKIQPSLKHAKKKIDDFHSQQKPKVNSFLETQILNYLLEESDNNKFKEQSEMDTMANQLKNKLMNMQVISTKIEEENKKNPNVSQKDIESFEELEKIKVMLSKLGINLDEKKEELFDKSNDSYFKTYKQTADRLRISMDKLIKDVFKRKWIQSHILKKDAKTLNNDNIHYHDENNEKTGSFITNIDNHNFQKSLNKTSSQISSSIDLQSKVKLKLERLMNSNSMFPFLSNKSENLNNNNQQILPVKLNRSQTYSTLLHANSIKNDLSQSHKNEIFLSSIQNHEQPENVKRNKAQTLHVKFGENHIRRSILEFNKISTEALKEHKKSLRKSRKSVYSPEPLINPKINVDLSNIKKFDEIMQSINDRNHMVSKFQNFLNHVDNTKIRYEKKTQIYNKNIDDLVEDMDILQEKMEIPIIKAIHEDVYTNEYIESRNAWYRKKMNKNLKKTIRLVLSQRK